MRSRLFFLLVLFFSFTAFAQKCVVKPNPAYDKAIADATTEKFFITELVDHLPQSSCVPSPDEFLHHIAGAPGVLTHVKDINDYMHLLASRSPRVKVFDEGMSEGKRKMLLVVISDEANIAKLDRYKEINARLADPRGLSDADAQKLIAEDKPMYWASGSIHSPETASPELLMELAYRLAVEDSPFIQEIRKDSIIMITPVAEVDGRDRMVDVYTYHHDHPDEPQKPLVWWGQYVAHDNNRDGMQLSLDLSRHQMATFLEYHPQVFHDLHESVPYLYVSTGTGPYNAWLDPITINEWQSMAYYEINEMTKRGVIGIWTHNYYDGWAPNYMFYLANGHNAIGRFYETFGNGGADTRERTLPAGSTSREWYRPNPPLPKVKWSIRNNVNMAQSALLLGMNNVATNGQRFLENFYEKSKRSVAKARTEGPAAYIFTADDPRPAEQARLLNLLKLQGVEVHLTTAPYTVPASPTTSGAPPARGSQVGDQTNSAPPDPGSPTSEARRGGLSSKAQAGSGTQSSPRSSRSNATDRVGTQPITYPTGSYVVRMDQPYSRMADMMLDTQYYSPRDPRSYDDTGWTLGALRNVKTARITDQKILDVPMQKITGDVSAVTDITGSGATYLINDTSDNPITTLRFKKPQANMQVAEAAFDADGRHFNAGTVILRDANAKDAADFAHSIGLRVHATSADIKASTHGLDAPKIAILQTWESTQQDGWYRIAFDHLSVPYTYLSDTVVREMKPDELRQKFDVIIMPPYGRDLAGLIAGIPKREGVGSISWKNTPETPNLVSEGLNSADDIRGGLGFSGIANIQKFVADGGLLIATASSARIPVQAGMTEMVSLAETRALQAPGVVVQTNIEDKKSPIAYGYDDKLYTYFNESPVFRIATGFAGQGGGGSAPGGGGPGGGGSAAAAGISDRSSGRGSATDPDVIQARPYMEPERQVRRTPAEQEQYVPDELQDQARFALPPKNKRPRVIVRFAPERELMLSGMMVGGNELAEKPAVIDSPMGKGHIVLFAINPMWREETQGSFALLFNAIMNYDHLDVGR